MRIALILVLLLAGFTGPASAQHAHLPPAQAALPENLTPSGAASTGDRLSLDFRRNRPAGIIVGALVGAVAGAVVANHFVCTSNSGEGNAQGICKAAGLGITVGMLAGGIIGIPDRWVR